MGHPGWRPAGRRGRGTWAAYERKVSFVSMASEIEARVKKIIEDQLSVSAEQVTNEASFIDDLGADSLDTVELVMAFEEEFKLQIPDDIAEKITNVQQAIDHIKKHVS